MENEFRNHEGYPDPTAAKAMRQISREVKRKDTVVYVCSPYSGDIEKNVGNTKGYSRFVISRGLIPVNPILNLHGVLSEETDRETAIRIDLKLLERSDELWAFGAPSAGMKREISAAKKLGLTVRYFARKGGYGSEWLEI